MSHLTSTAQAVTTTKGSKEDDDDDSLTDYHGGLIALTVLILISNLFAIQIYKRHDKVRRNLSNVLLVSLAISDLIAGVVVLPFTIYCERELTIDNKSLIKACRINYLFQNFCGFSTIFHIIAVTVEKYMAVLHPFRRIYITTRGTYKKILVSVWLMALLFALVPLLWMFKDPRSSSWNAKFDNYGIFQIAVFFGLSLVVLTYCYCRMFIQIHAKLSDRSQARRAQVRVRNDRKTIIVFLMFFAIFVIGWFPWFLFSLHDSNFPNLSEAVSDFLVTLRFAGAFLNPFMYALLKNDYKEAVQADLRRCRSKCPMCLRGNFGRRPRTLSDNNNFEHTFESTGAVRLKKIQPRQQAIGSFTSASGCPSTATQDTDM